MLLPNAAGLAITLLGLNAYDRVAVILNFTAGKKALDLGHPHRAAAHRSHLEALRRGRQARGADRGPRRYRIRARRQDAHRLSGGRARRHRHLRQARRRRARRARQAHLSRRRPTRPTSRPSSSSPRAPRGRRRAWCSPTRNLVSNAQQSIAHLQQRAGPGRRAAQPAADVPFLRPDGRHAGAAARRRQSACSTRARCTTGRSRSSSRR